MVVAFGQRTHGARRDGRSLTDGRESNWAATVAGAGRLGRVGYLNALVSAPRKAPTDPSHPG